MPTRTAPPPTSYSRVAAAYDRTRYHPPEVSGKIATATIEAVERAGCKEPRFIEIGVGSGRVAMPIVARGYRYVGVDVSEEMLAQFRAKYAGVSTKVSLIVADARRLPFRKDEFDAAIAVGVLHLIEPWEDAVKELVRVVRPGGVIVEGWDDIRDLGVEAEISEQYRQLLKSLKAKLPEGRRRKRAREVARFLRAYGQVGKEQPVTEWSQERTPRDALEGIVERLYSHTWEIPGPVHREACTRLLAWAEGRFKDLDQPYKVKLAFTIRATRL